MAQLFWVGVGGAAGTVARYLVGLWALRTWGAAFPAGTVAVNLGGCLLMGIVTQLGSLPPTARLALTTGVLGGFTTYSTFNHETLGWLEERAAGRAVAYVLLTVLGGWLTGALGLAIGRWVSRA